ncbi:MAG: hypothetical protein HQ592_09680 [Planctomycetes bacterium]|nr:hypothetical protein [Planctomycetota bacterium]
MPPPVHCAADEEDYVACSRPSASRRAELIAHREEVEDVDRAVCRRFSRLAAWGKLSRCGGGWQRMC